MKLETTNPHCFTYQTDELSIELLGGVRVDGLDRMRVTMKVTMVNRKHVAQIFILFNWIKILPQGHKSELSTWLKMALFIAPIFLLLALLIKKPNVDSQVYSENKIKKGYLWLIVYIIVSISTLVLLIMYKKGRL
jgi:hypothetical protein